MLSINNLSHHFSGNDLFPNLSVQFHNGERVGIVGNNGCGKTTLLNIIAGNIVPEKGSISIPANCKIGFMKQIMNTLNEDTVFNEAKHAIPEIITLLDNLDNSTKQLTQTINFESKEYTNLLETIEIINHRLEILEAAKYEENIEKTLLGLGFSRQDFNRKITEFSGGWKMRVELAKILLSQPDVLLLDEPNNHLDIESIRWLENYINSYKGIALIVSHDRLFLDNTCTRTIEISSQKIYDYKGNFSAFSLWRDEMIESQTASLSNQAKEIHHIKEFIDRFRYKSSKAKQVQSKIKLLEKIETISIEYKDLSSISFLFPKAPSSGKVVVEANKLSKSYGNINVFNNIDFTLLRGDRVAFIGKNGEGKSTLAKIITGNETYNGNLLLGHNVNVGYFAQNQPECLDKNKTIFQTIDDLAVGDIRLKVRSILGGMLFTEEDMDKKVSVLSGGEKTRLAISCMLLNPFNLLVMDEPTNHLDMISKDVLKNALLHYGGNLILISHDRDFLSGLTDKVFDFHNHTIKQYTGGIEEYLERNKINSLDEISIRNSSKIRATVYNSSENKQLYEDKKEIERHKRKLKKSIELYENQITEKECQIKNIETDINTGITSKELFEKYKLIQQQLNELIAQWEQAINELNDN